MKRLLLFDIDGTLVWGGPAKAAFEDAMNKVFGTAGPIGSHDFSGKTDPQIARELLTLAGFESAGIEAGFDALWQEYLSGLGARLVDKPMSVLPGVEELLDTLAHRDDVGLGLLTGNIAEGARLKLDSVGLTEYFQVGGYGSDAEDRDRLPSVAMGRANEHFGTEFSPGSVGVVGDTPRDVACGKNGGTKTVAVATGWYDADTLASHEPDSVLEDLGDLGASLRALMT